MSLRNLKSVEDVRRHYDHEAATYQVGEGFKFLLGEKRLRRRLFSTARGKILDVACGTGENFPFFSAGSDVTAIELSTAMLEQARRRARKLGLQVNLQQMDAQHLEFAVNSFDTVTSALSTCTFPDPIMALREMGRVCKPDGRILLFEHGLARYRWMANYQHRKAQQQYDNQACRWNQDPFQLVTDAGLTLTNTSRALLGIYYIIEA
ncbi:MAG: class I SAM-dependent methyltransferase, partial [Anaerolineae bacterium]|nr:class I SAM-dependent methyltransferase [Anaerolineae bacterium]